MLLSMTEKKTVTTIEIDEEDKSAIEVIREHVKAEYPLYRRGEDVSRRTVISFALRTLASQLRITKRMQA